MEGDGGWEAGFDEEGGLELMAIFFLKLVPCSFSLFLSMAIFAHF